jgi:hypothetical protein
MQQAASRKLTNANGPNSEYNKIKIFPPANKKFSIKHKRKKETIIKSAPSRCPTTFTIQSNLAMVRVTRLGRDVIAQEVALSIALEKWCFAYYK